MAKRKSQKKKKVNPDFIIQNKIKKILEECGFKKVAREVFFEVKGSDSNFSLDICTIYDNHLFLIECKATYHNKSSRLNLDLDHAKQNMQKILKKKIQKISVKNGNIQLKDINKIEHVHYGFVFEDTKNKDEYLYKKLSAQNMAFWNENAINHFYNSSKVLGSTSQYEILKEFYIKPIIDDFHAEPAVQVKQNDNVLYLLGMHPSYLIRMGYVFRRISSRPSSYQRVISKNRLPEIKEFYTKNRNLLLPNSVIIAFDGDKQIQKEVKWNVDGDGKLHFPDAFSCAWIIDGQHRVYGFKDTKYAKIPTTQSEKNKFKLPVIAFESLPAPVQSRAFVDINYYQKRINTILIYDLVSSYPDLKYELTWPSLLVKKLNEREPWKGKIQTTQNDVGKPVNITSFVRPVLFEKLLGYNSKLKNAKFQGPLFKASQFNSSKKVDSEHNQNALEKQLVILTRYFDAIKKNANSQWSNPRTNALTRFPGVNAMLLTLTSILKKYPKAGVDMDKLLKNINQVKFSRARLKHIPRGYSAINKLHEEMIEVINKNSRKKLEITKL